MAHSPSHSTGHGVAHGAEDMNLKKIVLVGVVSLSVFAVGIIVAYFMMAAQLKELREKGVASPATEIGKPEIGIVDQVVFTADHRIEAWKADHAKKLRSYGWVDKARGVARIPIDQAIQKVIAAPPDIPGEGVPPASVAAAAAPAASEDAVPAKVKGEKGDREARKAGGKK